MTLCYRHPSPKQWLQSIFDAKAARQGGVVRRNLLDIDKVVGRRAFEAELRRRGFRAVQNGNQVIIFCNTEPVHVLV